MGIHAISARLLATAGVFALAMAVSGCASDPKPETTGSKLRWVPRVLLFVPRWGFWLAMQPLRLGAWAYERYDLFARVEGALFNVDQTYGIYPVGKYSTDYGFSVGLRAVHYNLLGKKESLTLLADFGGQFQQAYGFKLGSGERVAHRIKTTLEARYERRPGERFFGIGNARELAMPPAVPIDPATSDDAIASRFRENLVRVVPGLDAKLVGPLSARIAGAYAHRTFSSGTIDGIADRYDTSRLVGFATGVDNIYLEGELIYDSRRATSIFNTQAIDAAGWYLAGHFGQAKGLGDDHTDFFRYGGEVQRYIDLYGGTRVLALRVQVDAIGGSDGRTDGKISFVDLPRLGGPDYLRGYPMDRFRDRSLVLATAEYTWDIGNYMAAYLFVDAGRAQHDLAAIDLTALHVGFGGGVELHSDKSFLMRGQLAYSRENSLFVELVLEPAFGRRERAGRY